MSDILKLNCGRCDYGLAFTDGKRLKISIRYDQLYLYFMGGMLKVVCMGCATPNLIVDTEFEAAHADVVEAEKKDGVVLAISKPWVARDEYVPSFKRRDKGRNFRPQNNQRT